MRDWGGRRRALTTAAVAAALAAGALVSWARGDHPAIDRAEVAGGTARTEVSVTIDMADGSDEVHPVPEPTPAPPAPRPLVGCADLPPAGDGFDERFVTDVAVSGDDFVAAVVDPCGDGHLGLWRSPDGTSWTPLPVAGAGDVPLTSAEVTAVDGRVAVVGWRRGGGPDIGYPRVAWTTADQRTWHAADLAVLAGGQLHDGRVVAAGEGFLAWASADAGRRQGLWWSATGESWSAVPLPPGVRRVADIAGSREAVAVLGGAGGGAPAPVVAVGAPGVAPAWREPPSLAAAIGDGVALGLSGYPDGLAVDLDAEFANGGPVVWVALGRGDAWVPLADRSAPDGLGQPLVTFGSATAWVGPRSIVATLDGFTTGAGSSPVPLPTTVGASVDGGVTWERHGLTDQPGAEHVVRLVAGPRQVLAVTSAGTDLSTPGNVAGREPLRRLVVAPL